MEVDSQTFLSSSFFIKTKQKQQQQNKQTQIDSHSIMQIMHGNIVQHIVNLVNNQRSLLLALQSMHTVHIVTIQPQFHQKSTVHYKLHKTKKSVRMFSQKHSKLSDIRARMNLAP